MGFTQMFHKNQINMFSLLISSKNIWEITIMLSNTSYYLVLITYVKSISV